MEYGPVCQNRIELRRREARSLLGGVRDAFPRELQHGQGVQRDIGSLHLYCQAPQNLAADVSEISDPVFMLQLRASQTGLERGMPNSGC